MKTRRLVCFLLSLLLGAGCFAAPAGAAVISEPEAETVITRATGQFLETIPAHSIMSLGDSSVPLGRGEIVTYNCCYTSKYAKVEFGFIAPDGYFYGISGSDGRINKGIRVSEPGSYTLAILNDSDASVTVEGTVNY